MNKKINLEKIIEYFKNELEIYNNENQKYVDEQRFVLTVNILLFTALIVFLSAILQNTALIRLLWEYFNFIFLILTLLFFTMLISIFYYVFNSHRFNRDYLSKKISLEIIIKYLLHLKILNVKEKFIYPLVNEIKSEFSADNTQLIFDKKDYIKYEKARLKRFVLAIDLINNSLIKNEK